MTSIQRTLTNPLVLLGHPGHELRIYGWLADHRPEVWVITDGSGADAQPRVQLSRTLLGSLGARPGALFGAHTDRQVYEAILSGDAEFFLSVARATGARAIAGGHDAIVSDEAEGYNPTHDLCELVAASAAAVASRESGRVVPHYTFALTGLPDGEAGQRDDGDIVLDLDEARAAAKVQAALDYARTTDGTLLKEVEQTVARFGTAVFRRERLFAKAPDYETRFAGKRPFYEEHGERRAQSGHYRQVIRFEEHMRPIARALKALATG